LKAARFNTVLGNPEPKLEDNAELSETLVQLERYERRSFSPRKRSLLAMGEKYGNTFRSLDAEP
jgi:hypothetical protein